MNTIPGLQNHSTLISTNISGSSCWGIDNHSMSRISEVSEMEEGTECGETMSILNNIDHNSYFTRHCDPVKIKIHKICNNRHQENTILLGVQSIAMEHLDIIFHISRKILN